MDANSCIEHIRGSRKERAKVIGVIFRDASLRDNVRRYILKYGGQDDDVELVYDDMITQFVKMAFRPQGLEIKGTLNGYLFGIARLLWKQELRKKKVHQKYVDQLSAEPTREVYDLEELLLVRERKELLQKLLSHVGEKCKSVLMRWAYGYSMKEIAQAEDYKSDMMARKKKSKCLKGLKAYIAEHPDLIELFK